MHQIHVVAAEITQASVAIVPELSPVESVSSFGVRAFYGGAQPQVPIQMRWLGGLSGKDTV